MKGLKEIRESLGKTQVQVAREVGVTLNTYVKWEHGVMKPSAPNEIKLKKALNIK